MLFSQPSLKHLANPYYLFSLFLPNLFGTFCAEKGYIWSSLEFMNRKLMAAGPFDFYKDTPLRHQNTSGPPTWFSFIFGTCWPFWTVFFQGFRVIRVHQTTPEDFGSHGNSHKIQGLRAINKM